MPGFRLKHGDRSDLPASLPEGDHFIVTSENSGADVVSPPELYVGPDGGGTPVLMSAPYGVASLGSLGDDAADTVRIPVVTSYPNGDFMGLVSIYLNYSTGQVAKVLAHYISDSEASSSDEIYLISGDTSLFSVYGGDDLTGTDGSDGTFNIATNADTTGELEVENRLGDPLNSGYVRFI